MNCVICIPDDPSVMKELFPQMPEYNQIMALRGQPSLKMASTGESGPIHGCSTYLEKLTSNRGSMRGYKVPGPLKLPQPRTTMKQAPMGLGETLRMNPFAQSRFLLPSTGVEPNKTAYLSLSQTLFPSEPNLQEELTKKGSIPSFIH